ncbi:site-specific integrase [Kitasatospora sp. SUK 42]|uniref:site-specific integrase n=1 Tax=Kitasatospora sp. SUK 42 TaxID=1588882 RepID=UPI0018CB6F7D|nr:site-specific integrase [Kitasatospora sp. SUK 42]MBV2155295.1 site-specific integrase [Kitasatospora sp. SUK 42]
MIGTGIRKDEALALHWDDVHLPDRTLFVRATLSVIDNNQLLLTAPKTKASRTWVALSDRVVDTREDRAGSQAFGEITPAGGYVFHRHGRPLHPKNVLDRFHLLCDKAGVPHIAFHDLRHLTAGFATAAGVPLPVISKTLRHRTLSTTANIYADLTKLAARAAVDAVTWILDSADHTVLGHPVCRAQAPGASARACTGNYPPTSSPEQRNQPRPGRCGPVTTVRPPIDTETKRTGTQFPKYRFSQPTSQSGRQDLNLRPLDPQRSKGCPTTVHQSEFRRSGPTSPTMHEA